MSASEVVRQRINLQAEDLSSLSKATGIDVAALAEFMAGQDLPTNRLNSLVRHLWMGSVELEDGRLVVRKSVGPIYLQKTKR
jgi:hypothetical protein